MYLIHCVRRSYFSCLHAFMYVFEIFQTYAKMILNWEILISFLTVTVFAPKKRYLVWDQTVYRDGLIPV